MKIHIDETYIECDICKQKVESDNFFNWAYRIKVKKVERNGIKPYRKLDLCSDCYHKFCNLIRKELEEEDNDKEYMEVE